MVVWRVHLLVSLPLGSLIPACLCSPTPRIPVGVPPLGEDHISGSWSPHCSSFLINHRELLACPLRDSGVPSLSQASVRQPVCGQHHRFGLLEEPGGTHSSLLNSVAQAILHLCEVHRVTFLLLPLEIYASSFIRLSMLPMLSLLLLFYDSPPHPFHHHLICPL